MPWSRRLATPLLAGLLLLPTTPASAQLYTVEGWAISDDGLAYATNDTFDSAPTWGTVSPSDFPPAIADLEGPPFLYRVDGTLDTGTRIARVIDRDTVTRLAAGRTPVIATALFDDDGGIDWARAQHIVSAPRACPDDPGFSECLEPPLIASLVDMAAPGGTPVEPLTVELLDLPLIGSSRLNDDGTLFSLGGDSSVGTSLRIRDDGRIAARGDARISDGLGGSLAGFDAAFVERLSDDLFEEMVGDLQARARAVGASRPNANGVFRSTLDCPSSGHGHVISQFLLDGVGRGVGPAIDGQLARGVPVFITEIHPFTCTPPGTASAELPEGPAAGIYCASTRAVHKPFTIQVDGRALTWASYLEQYFGIVTVGISPQAEAMVHASVGGANGGEIFSFGLEGIPLDPASQTGPVLWLGDAQAGIDSYGPKRYWDLQLAADGVVIDLVDQQRELFGTAFEVGRSQKPVTNCPDFDFSEPVFSYGFGSSDVSAWSYTRPD